LRVKLGFSFVAHFFFHSMVGCYFISVDCHFIPLSVL
jgi:hypothetical protein